MALVTVQRSPSLGTTTDSCCETDGVESESQEEEEGKLVDNQQRSISECYFTVKGAALVLPQNECIHVNRKISTHGGDIQQHLQSMFYLLRAEDTLKMAVKLESIHNGRMRYLVVISCLGHQTTEESCLLGIDCNDQATIGMVLPVWADTRITLDGDGGFSVTSSGGQHIFKPVSVQAMWSALQTLHKASAKASDYNYYKGGNTHGWINYYENCIKSDRSCLNEWHAMDDLVSKRPPSPGSLRSKPMEREQTECIIRGKLKEIMMSVDLDEVTSKHIRGQLEDNLNMDLQEYKSFIDQEMIVILGQMDAATEIFEYLYLGSEWNASNLEELQRNGICQILNVTREIDNFFPGMFDYLNVRVYDEDGTELLRHWDKTYKFIEKAKKNGVKVLVHCKMGVSRSASVVIAYAMKAYDWNLQEALEFVKNKRSCIKPNTGFLKQLETYQGILDASKQRHNTLWRSKSETDLKSPLQDLHPPMEALKNPEPSPHENMFLEVAGTIHRPKSWSPEDNIANLLFPKDTVDAKTSSRKAQDERTRSFTDPSVDAIVEAKNKLLPGLNGQSYSVSPNKVLHLTVSSKTEEKVTFSIGDSDDSLVYECRNPVLVEDVSDCNVLMAVNPIERVSSVKDRINELESQLGVADARTSKDQLDLPELRGLVLNLANQFEGASKPNTPSPIDDLQEGDLPPLLAGDAKLGMEGNEPVVSQTKPPAPRHQAVLIKTETWASDPKVGKPSEEWQQKQGSPSCGPIEMVKKKDDLLMKVRVNSCSPVDLPSVQKHENSLLNTSANQTDLESIGGVVSSSPFINGPTTNGRKAPVKDASFKPGVGLEGNTSSSSLRKEDPFSAQLDRVFDREEEYQRKNNCSDKNAGELPSRQSSWGSCDSAIVIQRHDRKDSPSRQSSWGSNDSHHPDLSREGSWSSADCYRFSRPLTNPLSFGQRTSSNPDSQYSSPGSDCHLMPFAYDQTSTSTVKRMKTKDEESGQNSQGNLKRTNSFDGSLLVNSAATNTNVAKDNASSPIQRSQSLRTGNGTRLPRPNLRLHTPTPYKSPVEKEGHAPLRETADDVYFSRILHCASFPFLAQNTEKHPSCTHVHSASHLNIKTSPLSSDVNHVNCDKMKMTLCLDFSQVCQPESSTGTSSTSDDIAEPARKGLFSSSSMDDDAASIVKQQKKVLEKKIASNGSPNQVSENDHTKWQDFPHPASLGSSPEFEEGGLGKVKRLTRELESRKTSDKNASVLMKEWPVMVNEEGRTQNVQQTIERSLSSPAMQAINDASSTLEEKSVKTLVGKFESKDGHRPRYHSENETVFRTMSGEVEPLTVRSLVSPRETMRKFSLEVDAPRWQETRSLGNSILPRSPSLPLGNKLNSADLAKKNERNERRRASDFVIHTRNSPALPKESEGRTAGSSCGKVPSSKSALRSTTSAKSKQSFCGVDSSLPLPTTTATTISLQQTPPIPVGSATRRTRKFHGKTHPLTKLMVSKQRHSNALYNTM